MLAIVLSACTTDKVLLVGNLPEDNANQIVLALGNNAISATKEVQKDNTFNIYVEQKDQLRALIILKNNGQPRGSYATFGEVFKKDGFISSPLEEHGRFMYAMDQEITGMLMLIDGVVAVKTEVSLPLPDANLWQPGDAKPSVAVLIKYKQGHRIDLYINKIKNLVSGAVPGATPDRVQVLTVEQKEE
jgi:type III secretion protein J